MSIEKSDILTTVQNQLHKEWGLDFNVLEQDRNVFIESENTFFHMSTFGEYIIILAQSPIYEWAIKHFVNYTARDIMDGDNFFTIEKKLREYSKKLCGEHLRFLPHNYTSDIRPVNGYRYELYFGDQLKKIYDEIADDKDFFDNALNYNNDIIAYAAYDGGRLIALAAADNYKDPMWQIGIDTLPEYRKKGIAKYLVQVLKEEILKKDKIPYYTTWSANLASMNVALSSGFRPVCVEYFVE